MREKIAIHWFRQDLRLNDNKSLFEASKHKNVLPIYILDDCNSKEFRIGSASRLWLHYSLKSLNKSLDGKLSVYSGNPEDILKDISNRYEVEAIYWNRCYEPWRIKRDSEIKANLKKCEIEVDTFNSSLLWEPWSIKKDDGTPYKVFTPFYRKGCLNAEKPSSPISKPKDVSFLFDQHQIGIDKLNLLPSKGWGNKVKSFWNIGEEAAHKRFDQFIEEGLSSYKEGRNVPSKPYVSRLSPHIHFGEISSNQLWYSVRSIGDDKNIEHFCSELGWREFSYSQLFHNPELPKKNLQSKFDAFPWNEDESLLTAWKKGKTGIPMVDAGMRELWQTGYMHNRVRMIVGSFLVKNLRLHWHHGERWFWDTLFDADLANNSASWQWIAGCGADAAPYFRIFNPIMQGQKFDPNGEYVRQYVPEISSLPNKFLFNPWEASDEVLKKASIKLGSTYPLPIVDLKESRELALLAFQSLKNSN